MAGTKIELSPELIAEAVKRVVNALGESAPRQDGGQNASAGLNAEKDYPLAVKRRDLVRSATGKSLDDITLQKVIDGEINFDDMSTNPQTLEYQAQIAESVGRPRLAANLRRAAEMTKIPDERLLEMYNALRPYRSTKQELLEIANELESKYQARICAELVKEAAEVYEKRGRLRRD